MFCKKKKRIGNFLNGDNINAALGNLRILTFYWYCYEKKKKNEKWYGISVHTGSSTNRAFSNFFFLPRLFSRINKLIFCYLWFTELMHHRRHVFSVRPTDLHNEIRLLDIQRRSSIVGVIQWQTIRRSVWLLEIWNLGHYRGMRVYNTVIMPMANCIVRKIIKF